MPPRRDELFGDASAPNRQPMDTQVQSDCMLDNQLAVEGSS